MERLIEQGLKQPWDELGNRALALGPWIVPVAVLVVVLAFAVCYGLAALLGWLVSKTQPEPDPRDPWEIDAERTKAQQAQRGGRPW